MGASERMPTASSVLAPQRPGAVGHGSYVRLAYAGVLTSLSLAATLLICCRFCPRVYIWKALEIPAASYYPEIFRAHFVLKQEAHPFDRITDFGNRGAEWRLLFPVLGHELVLPPDLILFSSHLGAVAVLAYVMHTVVSRSTEWASALMSALLLGTTSWFFVSTGWLGYGDSWCVLGLFAIAFADRKMGLAEACLLVPWIDERFLIGLPIAFVVRAVDREWTTAAKRREMLWAGVMILIAILPYLLLRAIAPAANSSIAQYIRAQYQTLHTASPARIFFGLWAGLRFGWIYVLAAAWWLGRRTDGVSRFLCGVIVLVTFIAACFIADDLSRNSVIFVPMVLFGIIATVRSRPIAARSVLLCATALNLAAPATIVLVQFTSPMDNVISILKRYRGPPPDLSAAYYQNIASQLWKAGRRDEARRNLAYARQLE
jgi:hypothetical protein